MLNLFLTSAAAATVVISFGGALGAGSAAYAQGGSYQQTCRNTRSANGSLTAECLDGQGQYHSSTLPTGQCKGDIANQNGMLSCNGARASGGQIVGGANNNRGGGDRGGQNNFGGNNRGGDDRRYDDNRRDNNGGFVAGALAGALLGGALAGNAGAAPPPPPPPPPAYGDPRYGDPRFDWRYQQGGYGYGRRPGEWVPIDDRADWLNRQIDDLQRSGRIDFRDARDYRRQLDGIRFQERDMTRYGRLGPRQRDDLDHRFNDLVEEIRHDARED